MINDYQYLCQTAHQEDDNANPELRLAEEKEALSKVDACAEKLRADAKTATTRRVGSHRLAGVLSWRENEHQTTEARKADIALRNWVHGFCHILPKVMTWGSDAWGDVRGTAEYETKERWHCQVPCPYKFR